MSRWRRQWPSALHGGTLRVMEHRARTTVRSLARVSFLVGTLSACAGGGRAWVKDTPRRDGASAERTARNVVVPGLAREAEEPAPFAERRVITLGSRSDADGEAPPPASPPAAPNVVVQVNVTAPQWGYGYVSYAGYPGWAGEAPDRPAHPEDCDDRPGPEPSGPSAPPSTGGNWPAPPSYGPPPISHTVPGDPWR